jgi:DNA-binding transcriptional regulator YiaG
MTPKSTRKKPRTRTVPDTTKFRELRQACSLSVNETADLMAVSPVTVRRWEIMPDSPSARQAPALAYKVLGWYLGGVPPHNAN